MVVRQPGRQRKLVLVHATHIDELEIQAITDSGAVVCLCPSTEANLGDGLFPLQNFLEQGGRIAIGSDSHVSINPFEELRWLEYGQRLISKSRNIAAIRRQQTGRSLFEMALDGGALAGGEPGGRIQTGRGCRSGRTGRRQPDAGRAYNPFIA